MRRAILAAATVLATATTGIAQNATNPGGPWITPAQDELGTSSLEGFMTYEELTAALVKIEANSKGRMEIGSIATSAAGREVWVGRDWRSRAKPAVMVINQQHGDEPHGAEAAIDIIKLLASNGDDRAIRRDSRSRSSW